MLNEFLNANETRHKKTFVVQSNESKGKTTEGKISSKCSFENCVVLMEERSKTLCGVY